MGPRGITVPLGLGCPAQLGERFKYGRHCPFLQPVIPTDSHQLKAVLLEVFGAEVDVLRGRVPQALAAGVQPLTIGQPQAAPRVVLLGKSAEPQTCERQAARSTRFICPSSPGKKSKAGTSRQETSQGPCLIGTTRLGKEEPQASSKQLAQRYTASKTMRAATPKRPVLLFWTGFSPIWSIPFTFLISSPGVVWTREPRAAKA